MSIKILGGQLSGLSLSVPKGPQTRPTSVMLRRKVFDAHQNLNGYIFFDLCAGTGAMGLEACSRGADAVYFVEQHSRTLACLKQNVKLIKDSLKNNDLECKLEISKSKIESYLPILKKNYLALGESEQRNTIFFLDPPYENIEIYEFFLSEVLQAEWFKGVAWIESDNNKGLLTSWWEERGVKARKIYQHSDSTLLITES